MQSKVACANGWFVSNALTLVVTDCVTVRLLLRTTFAVVSVTILCNAIFAITKLFSCVVL